MLADIAFVLLAAGLVAQDATSAPEITSAVPRAATRIGEALCGRGDGADTLLARALDDPNLLDDSAASWAGRASDTVSEWLAAAPCAGPTPTEDRRRLARINALKTLQRTIDRVRSIRQLASDVAKGSTVAFVAAEWPTAADCVACARLYTAGDAARDFARRVSAPVDTRTVGGALDAAATLQPQVHELCIQRPRRADVSHVQSQFLYYTWTRTGAWLMTTAVRLRQPDVDALCDEP